MEDIDKKIDIILRQKLLMGYNPSFNLKENIQKVSESKELLNEAGFLIWPLLKAAGYVVGVLTAGYWAKQAVDARGRNRPLDELYSYFAMCDRIPNIAKKGSNDIANSVVSGLENAYNPAALFTPSLNPTKIWKGWTNPIEANVEGKILADVYEALKELKTFNDFCLAKQTYWDENNIQLYTVMKKEHVKAEELFQVNQMIGKLLDNYTKKMANKEVPCIVNLIKNQFNKKETDPFPSGGYKITTNNPEIQQRGGIVLTSLYPDPRTGYNWHFGDNSVYGFTSCDANGCVKFTDKNGKSYYTGKCFGGKNAAPKCISNFLYNNYGIQPNAPLPKEGILINSTQNPEVEKHGGIVLKLYYPSTTYGTNWYFKDRSSYGKTVCDDDGCIKFINTSGKTFYIHSCYEKNKNKKNETTTGGGGATTGGGGGVTRFCPNGFQFPSDGVYKKCSKGEPVKKLQQCLGVTVDGFFGPNTFNALQSQKRVTQFTEQDLATLCQSNVVVPPTTNKFDWLGGEDLSIENF
jgi:hypothetical protein